MASSEVSACTYDQSVEDPHANTSSYCVTINNYTDDDVDRFLNLERFAKVLYGSYEKAETTGTPHIQGYVTFKTNKRFGAVRNLLPRAAIFTAKGNKRANHKYIIQGLKQDGTAKEHSEPFIEVDITAQGTRTDLEQACEILRERGIKRMAREMPTTYIKYHKGFEKLLLQYREPDERTEYPTVYWLYGPTGIGKSYYAREQSEKVFYAASAPNWYDGLLDHDWIVFDELDKGDINTRWILMITDKYAYKAPVKGGFVEFNVPNIVITTSVEPSQLFYGTEYDQVLRRLTWIGTRQNIDEDWVWDKHP